MSDLDKKLKDELHIGIRRMLMHINDRGYHEDDPANYAIMVDCFKRAGWVKASNSKIFKSLEINGHLVLDGKELMTGQEWYDKFLREYRLRADWIGGDEDMGEDAEHDVLFAARMASGIE